MMFVKIFVSKCKYADQVIQIHTGRCVWQSLATVLQITILVVILWGSIIYCKRTQFSA